MLRLMYGFTLYVSVSISGCFIIFTLIFYNSKFLLLDFFNIVVYRLFDWLTNIQTDSLTNQKSSPLWCVSVFFYSFIFYILKWTTTTLHQIFNTILHYWPKYVINILLSSNNISHVFKSKLFFFLLSCLLAACFYNHTNPRIGIYLQLSSSKSSESCSGKPFSLWRLSTAR